MNQTGSKARSMDAAIADKIEAQPELLEIPLAISNDGWRRIIPHANAGGLHRLLSTRGLSDENLKKRSRWQTSAPID